MKKLFVTYMLVFIFGYGLFGQESEVHQIKRNTIHLEVGGASFLYSINYDRLILDKQSSNIALRSGMMYASDFQTNDGRRWLGFNIGSSYLKKLNKNFLEFGITSSLIRDRQVRMTIMGSTRESDQYVDTVLMNSMRVGIRHQPINNHLFWNALLQYSVALVGDHKGFKSKPLEVSSFPLISLGIGYSF